ncbi:MAG: glycosyltransferase [Micavibrio sp.]|nr:glycosyltransferase [Micavibrio sp.]
MRILNIMLGKKRGGLEQVAVDYCVALRSLGHEVTMAVAAGAAVLPQLKLLSIPVIEIPLAYRWNPLAGAKLRRLMGAADVSIVHGNRAGQLTAGVQGTPVIAVAHSRFFNFYPHFSALVALSGKMAAQHKEHGVPVTVVPNFVQAPPALPPRPAFRAPPVLGTMGRFSPEKGMDMLLDAVAALKAKGTNLRLVIGGDGKGTDTLQQQAARLGIADSVTFAGWVTDKQAFFDSIDIFCLPSRAETFSVTLVEAMAQGCPVVATMCDGPSEIIRPAATGILTPIEVTAFAAAIEQLAQAPAMAAALGAAAREDVLSRFDMPVVAAKLDALLKSVAPQK